VNQTLKDSTFRKANELSSQVLTHENSDLRQERVNNFQNQPRIQSASNVSWNHQTGMQKPNNNVQVDAYKKRQGELESTVMDKTDYSQFNPSSKKDNIPQNGEGSKDLKRLSSPQRKRLDKDLAYANGTWTQTDVREQIKKDYSNYDPKEMKQKEMGFGADQRPATAKAAPTSDEYQEKVRAYVPAKTAGQSIH
jgi:hypothetical protein